MIDNKKIIILIPPSERKRSGGESPSIKTVSLDAQEMVDRLLAVKINEWEKLLGVKGKTLEQAVCVNKNVLKSKTLSAIDRYVGVVYNGVGFFSLNKKTQNYFNEHIGIISALFGFVQPQDLIPNYKLKINKLGADKYWKPIIAQILKEYFVIDLLPQAHKKAISYDSGIDIEFVIIKNKNKIPAGHNGKYIKGRFIRWLCEHQITEVNEIKEFKEDGFVWKDQCFIKTV